jgi:hypothetical protein
MTCLYRMSVVDFLQPFMWGKLILGYQDSTCVTYSYSSLIPSPYYKYPYLRTVNAIHHERAEDIYLVCVLHIFYILHSVYAMTLIRCYWQRESIPINKNCTEITHLLLLHPTMTHWWWVRILLLSYLSRYDHTNILNLSSLSTQLHSHCTVSVKLHK